MIVLPRAGAGGGVEWGIDAGILIPLVVSATLYALGVRALRRRGAKRGLRTTEIAAFAAGLLTLGVALLSLHEVSEQLFSAHMVQHELLMAVAAPLLVIGRPGTMMLWALPARARGAVGRSLRSTAWRSVWRALSRPFDAWLIHGVAIWCWHIPALFEATLHSEVAHAAQHLSFVGSALLFWWAMIHPRRRADLGLSIIYLFTTAVHTAVLGALITFSRHPWYPDYASGAAAWGLTPIADQQLAGLVMWIPAGIAYLVAALLILRRWLASSEWSIAHGEQVRFAS